jgi:hypothetical protein
MVRSEQNAIEHDRESRAEAFLDGEKTGVFLRAGATALDKLYLHSPLTNIDAHLSVGAHVTPSRMFLGGIAAIYARNMYQRLRQSREESRMDDIDRFEQELELEELREISEANQDF